MLRFSLYMDLFVALLSWLLVRGSKSGPLFCDVISTRSGSKIVPERALSSTKFTVFLRTRLQSIGVGKEAFIPACVQEERSCNL